MAAHARDVNILIWTSRKPVDHGTNDRIMVQGDDTRADGRRSGSGAKSSQIVDSRDGRAADEVPFLRPADGAISIAMDRRVSDGAVVSTSFDVHIPQRGAGVFHLALASLPVSTIVSLKLRVGDQSPLR